MSKYAAIALMVLVFGCAINPATIEVSPKSEKALLVLQVDKPMRADSIIRFVKFAKCGHSFDYLSAVSGAGSMMEKRARSGSYLVAEIPPGIYAMTEISQQETWVLALTHTVSFEARSGEVLLIGKFDPVPHFRLLQGLAKNDPIAMGGQRFVYANDMFPVRIEAPRELDISTLQVHLSATFPRVTAPIRAAEIKEDQLTDPDPTRKTSSCNEPESKVPRGGR